MKLALAAIVLALAGCSSGSAGASGTATQVVASQVVTSAPPSASAPLPTQTPSAPPSPKAGATVTLVGSDGSKLRATVHEVKDVKARGNAAGTRWVGVLVEVCIDNLPSETPRSSLSWGPWSMIGSDGGRYPMSSSTWGDFPKPQYPFGGDEVFNVGDCAKGWMLGEVNTGVSVAKVRYSNDSGMVGTWAIG